MRAHSSSVLIALLASACGCAAPTPGVSAETPPLADARTEIRLRVGQEAGVIDANLKLRFEGVDGDSRCAKGETCVWEGSAAVRLTVAGASGTQEMTLHTSTRSGPDRVDYGGWAIRLVGLEPHPVAGRAIEASAYVATLSVERGDSGIVAR